MILRTYRIDQKQYSLVEKIYFFREISDFALKSDSFWHFFLDPSGATFRFLPQSEKKVKMWLIKNAHNRGIKWRKSTDYDPAKHEYWGVSFLGEDILPLFHAMSLLSMKYPFYVVTGPILERLNHGLVNMTGIHDFRKEAELYLGLAMGRARFVPYHFQLPTWTYKLFIKYWPWEKYEKFNLPRRKRK